MILCTEVEKLQALVKEAKKSNKSIGLVPTMGALHKGHMSLIEACHAENDLTIVSDFVNPVQFGPNEDYEKYPRQLSADTELAQKAGAEVLFAPKATDFYPDKDMTWVEVTGNIVKVLCGRTRPIHFRGVATVVSKLFHLAQPDKAYFGQKDAQQVEVLKKMVHDLFIPVKLRIMPIVRDTDGLAISSRNAYLSDEEHKNALVLNQSLKHAASLYAGGERNTKVIRQAITDMIAANPMADIDYVELYQLPGLKPMADKLTNKTLAAVAVRFGKTRLIDNIIL